MKPMMFVGSSRESIAIARALADELEHDADVTVWDQDVFGPSAYPLDSLFEVLDASDCAAFVFSPDDMAIVRDRTSPAVRDNVLFELGMFIGKLGRQRVAVVAPRRAETKIPSDLLGLTLLQVDLDRADRNLRAAIGPAANSIRGRILALPQRKELPETRIPFEHLKYHLSQTQRKVLGYLERRTLAAFSELVDQFDRVERIELHYRLEQLRLLGFIEYTASTDQKVSKSYQLTAAYVHALNHDSIQGRLDTNVPDESS